MVNGAIHRVIEMQAAMRPDALAVDDGRTALTYRELNQRANALARRLGESGLTRGALAFVRMERGVDLAVVLLAVLKSGSAYAWVEPGSPDDRDIPAAFCMMGRPGGDEQPFLALDLRAALAACASRPSPNLPVMTRGSDIACVLSDAHGQWTVPVRHAAIAASPSSSREAEGGAFDLWIALMSGATLTFTGREETVPRQASAAA